jgi:hypothetical protein
MAYNQNLFEALDSVYGFVATDTDMEEIKRAILLDEQQERSPEAIALEKGIIEKGILREMDEMKKWASGFIDLTRFPEIGVGPDDVYSLHVAAFFQEHGNDALSIFQQFHKEVFLLEQVAFRHGLCQPAADLTQIYAALSPAFYQPAFQEVDLLKFCQLCGKEWEPEELLYQACGACGFAVEY